MDSRYFELFLRRTTFSQTLLAEIWDGLTTKERVEVLLHPTLKNLWPPELAMKAASDSNAAVRMLSVRWISEKDDPESYAKLKLDESPLVRAAIAEGRFGLLADPEKLLPLSQIERLGVVALSSTFGIGEEPFAKFIVDSLQNHALSESEAAELLCEFIRNPRTAFSVERQPLDGMDWHSIRRAFEAIWNLTTCTPIPVHHTIAWEYPLQTGHGDLIPAEMFTRMSVEALSALVFRGHKPLLDQIMKTPESFDEHVREAVEAADIGKDAPSEREARALVRSDLGEARQDVVELRQEMRELFEALKEQIDDALSRRRGFFG